MAFEPAQTISPSSIGNITITLEDISTGEEAPDQRAAYLVVVWYDDNTRRSRGGNLVPHISTEDRDWLVDFMNRMRAQAEIQILP